MIYRFFLIAGLASWIVMGQDVTPEQKTAIDAAIPTKAQAKPQKPRRILVSNLAMRDGKPWRGSSAAHIPAQNYAFEQLGRKTGAFEAVFNNDVEMLRPDKIKQFDAVCFLNTVGVLFEDAELKKSLLDYIASGKGFVGIHDAIATFVQYPKYDQWPPFGQMLGATENGGHPWNGETMTLKIDDPKSPINAVLRGESFQIADQAFQFQEPQLRDRLHILFSIDVARTQPAPRRVLKARQTDMDFPMSWIRRYGKGRVYFFGLGHTSKIFENPALLRHKLAGTQYALGDLKADDSPSGKGAK